LEQLGGQRGDLLRVGLLGLGDVLDRPPVDAAVVVDAVEDGLRRLRDVGEVDTRLLGDDGADLDRIAGGLLAVAEAALRRRGGRCRRAAATAAAAAARSLVVVAATGSQ